MIKPPELNNITWNVITAAASGDATTLRRLLAEDPDRSHEGYWYTPPIHFAVREGHTDIVQMLLDAGADSEWNGYYGDSLIAMAKERDYDSVVTVLEQNRDKRGRVAPSETPQDHEIHTAAEAGNIRRVRALLDQDPALVNRGDHSGGTPLHRAVLARRHDVINLLVDRGANVHAIHGTGSGSPGGFAPYDVQAIDIALWGGIGRRRPSSRWRMLVACAKYYLWGKHRKRAPQPCDPDTARLLIRHGAAYDLTVAAALGDIDRVKAILDANPEKIQQARPNGRRPLTTAVEFGRDEIIRLLLERGANPTWPELNADKGGSLHHAAGTGNRPLVELLLAHGADPNGGVDSSGNAMYAAKTPEIRELLKAHGGTLDPYDLVWMDQDDEVIRRVTEDPKSAELGCGGVFTAVCTKGKRDLLKRLLDAGIRVPPVVTGCQSYLLEQPDMLRTLLDHGMNPDTCNWQRQTMLHMSCSSRETDRNGFEAARMLLDAGATISARDEDYSSTPLAWAARNNNVKMVKFLLSRGAPTNLPDDKPWATPLAWASRRGHTEIVDILRAAGAVA
jgi:ankyrin repeat protein